MLVASDMRLSTSNLPDLTEAIDSQARALAAEKALRSGCPLPVTPILDPEDGRRTWHIGSHESGFGGLWKVSKVGQEIVQSKTKSTGRASRQRSNIASISHANPTIESLLECGDPYAVALQIQFHEEIFSHGHDDIRFDVFYNGQLAASDYVSYDMLRLEHSGVAGRPSRIVRIVSGYRIDECNERPWIIVPEGGDPSGDLVDTLRATRPSAEDRWKSIGKSLQEIAEVFAAPARQGGISKGEGEAVDIDSNLNIGKKGFDESVVSPFKTPLADYLMALSSVKMPTGVVQSPRSVFGVIDVVICAGQGTRLANHTDKAVNNLHLMLRPKENLGPTDSQLPAHEMDSIARRRARPADIITDKALPPSTVYPSPVSPAFPNSETKPNLTSVAPPAVDWIPTQKKIAKEFEHMWKSPASCEHSHLAFVEHGMWEHGHSCGIYRPIRPTQRSEFMDKHMMGGFRFVVGM